METVSVIWNIGEAGMLWVLIGDTAQTDANGSSEH